MRKILKKIGLVRQQSLEVSSNVPKPAKMFSYLNWSCQTCSLDTKAAKWQRQRLSSDTHLKLLLHSDLRRIGGKNENGAVVPGFGGCVSSADSRIFWWSYRLVGAAASAGLTAALLWWRVGAHHSLNRAEGEFWARHVLSNGWLKRSLSLCRL